MNNEYTDYSELFFEYIKPSKTLRGEGMLILVLYHKTFVQMPGR
jgi:hypothetical protein